MSSVTGQIVDGVIIPKSTITWADLANSPFSTWDNWTQWDGGSPTGVSITTNSLDFGRVDDFVVEVETEINGPDPSITVQVSSEDDSNPSDGSFSNVTETSVSFSDSIEPLVILSGIRARHARLRVVAGPSSSSRIDKIFMRLSNTTNSETFRVNTSDLGGSQSARELVTNKTYSKITNIVGLAQSSGEYVDTDSAGSVYVASDYVEAGEALFISVVNIDNVDAQNNNKPTIAVFDKDGNNEDATVFLQVEGLPLMERKGTNIEIRKQ